MRIASLPRQHGSVLMVTLLTAFVMGIGIASYLMLVNHQNSMVARSQAWNAALAMAEAGVEEGFAKVNVGMPRKRVGGVGETWSQNMADGSYSVSYADYASSGAPLFYSTGYVAVPSQNTAVVRVVRVQTKATSLFAGALVALGDINLKGNNISTDSYNSTNGSYASSPHGTNGDVASIYGLVNVGGADIHGDVLLGASNTNSLQSVANSINKNGGQVTGAINNDFNMDLPVVNLPADFNSFGTPTSDPTNYPGFTYVTTTSGDYTLNGLTSSLIVPSNKTVRLYITGNVNITSNPGITVQQGGNLTLYMGGSSFSVSGGGTLNVGGTPESFSYMGLTNNTSISMSGNAIFTGTIYAPNAVLSPGSGNAEVFGSVLVKSAQLSGNMSFHFDDALLDGAIIRGYVGSSWQEISP